MTVKTLSLRAQLLIGVSVGAMLFTGVAEAQSGRGRGGASVDPAAAAVRAAQQQAERQAQANSASQRAIASFRRAADGRVAMQAAQAAARAAAQAAQSSVPNGLGQGGLRVANGAAADPNLWIGAKGPTQTTGADGRVQVAVDQTQQNAILTWDSFNVGRETDLTFNQQGADWVAINRVTNASADPSRILGSIKATGSVYILNRNGVIFGGASQVNVRNLIVASANITNAQFLDRGIYSSLSGVNYVPSFTDAGGAITVEAGARINTLAPQSVTAGGGFVLLMGTSVVNKGAISTPRGQTLLSAGDDFILRRGYGTEENKFSTTRGNEVRGLIDSGSTSGAVTNAGQIEAAQGDITLAGRTIRQDGVLVATTGVNQRGTIHLLNSASDTQGSVTLGKDSLTLVLPELDSADTALNSQRDALIAESDLANTVRASTTTGGFDDRSLLADRLDQGRVEIVTGGDVLFQGGSQTMAQGGQVAVQANAGRITVETGAAIDVSGVMGVSLDMGSNAIKVNIQGNELRDSPGAREEDALKSKDVWIDVRDLILLPSGTGGYEGDRWYTPGGLLEVGGYLANTRHGIGEWAAVGGTITLSASEVIAQKGAVFDLSGGSIDYAAGYIRSTRLLGADGRMYDVRNAPAGMTFISVGDAFARAHSRWGTQYAEVYSNPLFSRANTTRWEEGYSVGRDAGRLVLSTPTAVMEADILAGVLNGERQTSARPDGVKDGYALGQNTLAKAGTLELGRYGVGASGAGLFNVDVRIGEVADVADGVAVGAPLPADRTGTVWLDAKHLNAQGLGGLVLATRGQISVESDLVLADGGSVDLVAPTIDIKADITARSGSISATNLFQGGADKGRTEGLFDAAGVARTSLRDGATLDVRGLWVNTALNAADANKLGLIDGGSVSLASTHDVVLEKGSVIDVSSGAAQLAQGKTKGGRGGDVTLIADLESAYAPNAVDGLLTLDGKIAAFGVSGGGTLKIESGAAISIGGKLTQTDGVLAAGERALVAVVLDQDYQVRAGEALPVDYSYTVSFAAPGEAIGPLGIRDFASFTTAANWVPPFNGVEYGFFASTGFYRVQADGVYLNGTKVPFIPAGSMYTSSGVELAGYVLPADVFPNGLAFNPYPKTLKAGEAAPFAVDLTAGTTLAAGGVLSRAAAIRPNVQLAAQLFQTGFSNYDVTARNGVAVTEGTRLDVTAPALRLITAAAAMATGAEPGGALELWTPPLYAEDPVNGVLTQRGGANLTLRSVRSVNNSVPGGSGAIAIGRNASVNVDPGRSITLLGHDMRVDGALNAWGGAITLDVPSRFASAEGDPSPGLIWIGETGVLDVAARAATAKDQYGRTYGLVADGGTISIGGALDWEKTGEAFAPSAIVAIQKGALLDASGASATMDIGAGGLDGAARPVTVASDGGSIILKSNNALYLDGALKAQAGGEGAAGGTLAVAVVAPLYKTVGTFGDILTPRELTLSQTLGDSLAAGVNGDNARQFLTTRTTRLGADRIQAGGFDNLSLFVGGGLSFNGDVTLRMDQSLRLTASGFGLAAGAASDSKIAMSAPYVRMAGVTRLPRDTYTLPTLGWFDYRAPGGSDATFGVKADLIDIRDTVGFGAMLGSNPTGPNARDLRGFATVDLSSTGDLRLLRGIERSGGVTRLETVGSFILTAAQVYPATDAQAAVIAGYKGRFESTFVPGTSITIRRSVAGDIATPYSAFGVLSLGAETINQGGVVRAPLGRLTIGRGSTTPGDTGVTAKVNLLAGGVTSVSGAGLLMPYGGSIDGVAYKYNGQDLELVDRSGFGRIQASIDLNGLHVAAEAGSVIDLSGGGDLTGAGFVSGRGGSIDVLKTALANANPGNGFSKAGNAVYAIVPTSGAAYAPAAADAGAGDPMVGQRITVPDGVPGLKAGTYTLMPSTYALLPGAFRVEIGAGNQADLSGVTPLGNGSYTVAGTLGVANTAIRDALSSQVLITPADVVRTYSSYNETSYDAFLRADASRAGVPRTQVAADAGTLTFNLNSLYQNPEKASLSLGGQVKLDPLAKSDGFAGAVAVNGVGEILARGQTATAGLASASVYADDLNALNAPRLLLNVVVSHNYGPDGRYATITGVPYDLTVRSGATLTAGDVILGGGRRYVSLLGRYVDSTVTVEDGAAIIAKSGLAHAFDSSDGYLFRTEGALVVSNGWFNMVLSAPPTASEASSGVNFNLGGCVRGGCAGQAQLISNGSIAIATNRGLNITDTVAYGTRNLVLGLSSVNLGETADLDAAGAAGQLPDGLAFNRARLEALLKGNTATGAPKLETLVLNARDAVNVYGSVELDASSLERLVFGAPAIYGYGDAGDVATIKAGQFIWTGTEAAPGAPVAGLLGHGALDIQARSILFGYGPNTQPAPSAKDNRLALGFGQVSLTAAEQITASGESVLSVYETRGAYVTGQGWQYAGGDLKITAPVVTGMASSKFTLKAGGDVTIGGGTGAAVPAVDALGAQLAISGRDVTVDTAVVLPSGKLTVEAAGDLALGGKARLDLSGREVALNDVKKYSWGGDVTLTSTGGDVTTAAGSVIDVSAINNRAGTLSVTALGAGAGQVDLLGTVNGKANGQYDAGGTVVPYDGAEVTVRAQTLADFAGLNERLNAGQVFGARRFQIKQGDLVVGDGVKARDVQIVVDGGDLTIDGRIDASGFQVGSIRLAAMGDLTVNGTLDAHGEGLRVDSYGKIIDSPNRATVDLTSRAGTLILADSAVVDLRAGTKVAVGTAKGQNDGVARGTLDLNAMRVGTNDVAVNVLGALGVQGAKTIAVNAFRTYDDAPLAALPDVSGNRPQLITQAYLDVIDGQSQAFINAALGNTALGARLAGLGTYHLRPGVEIVSNITTNPTGDLTVSGDLDLSAYRYGPGADRIDPARRGYGEPGVLVFRAAGDLNINGSINDGFAPPAETPDEAGWILEETRGLSDTAATPFSGDIVVPIDGVVLDVGTTFQAGVTLNYNVPVGAMTLPAGTVLPVDVVLTAGASLLPGTVVEANIYNANGTLAYAAGTVLKTGTTLSAGMKLGAGTTLRSGVSVAALTWPKGVPLPVIMATTAQITLARGSLIPSMTKIQLVNDAPVDLRPNVGGVQGRNWAVAPLLGEGSTSWDMQLVAGADLTSADVLAQNALRTGDVILADSHYGMKTSPLVIGVNAAGVDIIVAAAGGLPFGVNDKREMIGWTEQQIIDIYQVFTWDDFGLPGFWDLNSGNINLGVTAQGIDQIILAAGGLPFGVVDKRDMLGWTEQQIIDIYQVFTWDDFGLPGFWDPATGNAALAALPPKVVSPSFSVLRTGTGDLSLVASGDVRMNSLFGVYTAGTATHADAVYDLPRGVLSDGTLLGSGAIGYDDVLAGYHAWYPDQGGDLSITAGGNLIGDIVHSGGSGGSLAGTSSSLSGNWLWRQGSGSAATDEAIATAWWINFGAYTRMDGTLSDSGRPVALTGFTGFGTLGGGDVTIRVGGDAGKQTARGLATNGSGQDRSQGLVVAVGSTGRVGADGALTLTGGGDLDLRVAGALNPFSEVGENFSKTGLAGNIVNLRGATHIDAASVGTIKPIYQRASTVNQIDPRGGDPFEAPKAQSFSGLVLTPGDSTVTVQTLGDMVIAGAGDATRSYQLNSSPFILDGVAHAGGGSGWFSLWTDHTAITLTSAGGDMAPSKSPPVFGSLDSTVGADLIDTWPAILRVAALGGNLYYGAAAGLVDPRYTSDTLAPSPSSQLEVLSAGSIYAAGLTFGTAETSRHGLVLSSTGTPTPTPFNPAFAGETKATFGEARTVVHNLSVDGGGFSFDSNGQWDGLYTLFAFGPNTAATAPRRAADAPPTRIYAVRGDIVGLSSGEERTFLMSNGRTLSTWYSAGAPLWMMAGRDIVASGTFDPVSTGRTGTPNVIAHSNTTDVSIVSAGRDIIYSNFEIAGPGVLEVTAGRNILQEDKGSFTSLGSIVAGDARPGASIALAAGMTGADWAAVRLRYLDPANLADPARPLADAANAGKAVKTYDQELIAWLGERYGFKGSAKEALAVFDTLAPEQQRVFLRQVYYAEAREGGREYNDADGPRFGSYLRGREMIATLFPDKDKAGKTITRDGDIVMFGGSGVRTNFGGDIEMMAPGGQIVIGVQGQVPPASAGVITQGQGDIRLFSEKSLLLGLSRLMTTFGGDIFAWSEEGDINAGRGSKSTVLYTPPRRIYDGYGNVRLAPQAPSSGAGIATLNPVAEVAPGDVDLIAPLGTIDAGEAGIRVSGNINLAALQVLNAANIEVQGEAKGVPLPPVVNVGALTAASSASTSAVAEAAKAAEKARPIRTDVPAIITSRFLGFGE